MRYVILFTILVMAALASNEAATNTTNGHKFAKVKGLERKCEQLLDGVFVYSDTHQAYLCQTDNKGSLIMLHTTKVGE